MLLNCFLVIAAGFRAVRATRGLGITATSIIEPQPSTALVSRRSVSWRRLGRGALLIALALLVGFVSLRGSFREVERTPYFNDESRWINRADFLKETLHPFSAFWEDRYIVRAQPPMGSYIIGLGLLVQGQDLNTNNPWIFEYGFSPDISWNVIDGAMPSRADLFAARRTNAVAGAVAVVSLFLLVAEFTNWLGGIAGALFLAVNPLQLYLSSLGVSDELFVALFALSALAALFFARAPSWPRALLLGLLIGMGTSTKLSPIFVGFALAAGGAALVIQPLINRLPKVGRLWRAIPGTNAPNSARVGWMLITVPLVAMLFCFVTFPYLWPAPRTRTLFLFDYRASEMDAQAQLFPSAAIDNRIEALKRIWEQFQNSYSTTAKYTHLLHGHAGGYIDQHGFDVPLGAIGLALLAVIVIRRGIMSPSFLAAFVLICEAGVITLALRVDFERYYGPILFVLAVGVGVACGSVAAAGLRWTGASRRSLAGDAAGPKWTERFRSPLRGGA